MTDPTLPSTEEERARFRRTLVKVMAMQVIALILLWWLQSQYAR